MENKIINHRLRIKYFISHVGTEDWFIYLRERSAVEIQWRYYWLKPRRAIIRGNELYFIELIGPTTQSCSSKLHPSEYLLPLVHAVKVLRISSSIMGTKVFPPRANIRTT